MGGAVVFARFVACRGKQLLQICGAEQISQKTEIKRRKENFGCFAGGVAKAIGGNDGRCIGANRSISFFLSAVVARLRHTCVASEEAFNRSGTSFSGSVEEVSEPDSPLTGGMG